MSEIIREVEMERGRIGTGKEMDRRRADAQEMDEQRADAQEMERQIILVLVVIVETGDVRNHS